MTEHAKCYIEYEGNTYIVTFCYGKIKVYLVTKYDIFKNIPVLKNFEKYKELFEKFDGLVFSGPIGLIKPKSEIFDYLIQKYHLKKDI